MSQADVAAETTKAVLHFIKENEQNDN